MGSVETSRMRLYLRRSRRFTCLIMMRRTVGLLRSRMPTRRAFGFKRSFTTRFLFKSSPSCSLRRSFSSRAFSPWLLSAPFSYAGTLPPGPFQKYRPVYLLFKEFRPSRTLFELLDGTNRHSLRSRFTPRGGACGNFGMPGPAGARAIGAR